MGSNIGRDASPRSPKPTMTVGKSCDASARVSASSRSSSSSASTLSNGSSRRPNYGTRRWPAMSGPSVSTLCRASVGSIKLAEISDDAVACLIGDMREQGYAPATTKAVLGPLSLILGQAVRCGRIGHNAVASLERRERPKGERRPMRILSREEMGALIEATVPQHRLLIGTLTFGGMRVGEALGLSWTDIDLERGQIHVPGPA